MIGQKGLPASHGGVERHVEELSKRLVQRGHEVTVYTRPSYSPVHVKAYEGIRLVSLPTISTKHLDAIVHSGIAAAASLTGSFDVVHFHAIGPCLVSPLARLSGARVVATIHGRDWQRDKWGRVARGILRLSEWMALTVPDETIVVSERLSEAYRTGGHETTYIPNGVAVDAALDSHVLDELGVRPRQYVLFAGRLVPEKGAHYLLEAHARSGIDGALVIAGDSSHSEAYVEELRRHSSQQVVFAGYRYGGELASLFAEAGLFALPSDLEGLPIVLLEALLHGAPVLASDIPPNQEVLAGNGEYFPAGDVDGLTKALASAWANREELRRRATACRETLLAEYDWDDVARRTEDVYCRIVNRQG